MPTLFDSIRLGDLELPNRVVMAPMTRSRANPADEPTALHVEYYRQRASAGLIVSEGVYPSPEGKGYCRTPGIVTAGQVDAWRAVVSAVHGAGGRFAMQLMHCGRIGHPLNKVPGTSAVSPSAVQANAKIFTEQGMQPIMAPRALELDEIAGVIAAYGRATELAFDAGCDLVELHCTSGYLPAQFLSTGTNQRTDAYGGSVPNRVRFVLEVLTAMSAVAGPARVGVRICPGNPFNDLTDADPTATFDHLLEHVGGMGLAYLHAMRQTPGVDLLALRRAHFPGPFMINDGYDAESATAALAAGDADLVSFGRHFISNPDLVERLRAGHPLAPLNPKALYSPGPEGYTDYPRFGA